MATLSRLVLIITLCTFLVPALGHNPVLEMFNHKVDKILQELRSEGWQPRVVSQHRTIEEQRELVRQGRSQTMSSQHLAGLAVDIIDKRYGWHGPASDLDYEFWRDLGEACTKRGLTWGGNWESFPDVAHCQWPR
jgi:peptidoglycan L-alanyl-D-glutamate endopeptidase CwlK